MIVQECSSGQLVECGLKQPGGLHCGAMPTLAGWIRLHLLEATHTLLVALGIMADVFHYSSAFSRVMASHVMGLL